MGWMTEGIRRHKLLHGSITGLSEAFVETVNLNWREAGALCEAAAEAMDTERLSAFLAGMNSISSRNRRAAWYDVISRVVPHASKNDKDSGILNADQALSMMVATNEAGRVRKCYACWKGMAGRRKVSYLTADLLHTAVKNKRKNSGPYAAAVLLCIDSSTASQKDDGAKMLGKLLEESGAENPSSEVLSLFLSGSEMSNRIAGCEMAMAGIRLPDMSKDGCGVDLYNYSAGAKLWLVELVEDAIDAVFDGKRLRPDSVDSILLRLPNSWPLALKALQNHRETYGWPTMESASRKNRPLSLYGSVPSLRHDCAVKVISVLCEAFGGAMEDEACKSRWGKIHYFSHSRIWARNLLGCLLAQTDPDKAGVKALRSGVERMSLLLCDPRGETGGDAWSIVNTMAGGGTKGSVEEIDMARFATACAKLESRGPGRGKKPKPEYMANVFSELRKLGEGSHRQTRQSTELILGSLRSAQANAILAQEAKSRAHSPHRHQIDRKGTGWYYQWTMDGPDGVPFFARRAELSNAELLDFVALSHLHAIVTNCDPSNARLVSQIHEAACELREGGLVPYGSLIEQRDDNAMSVADFMARYEQLVE